MSTQRYSGKPLHCAVATILLLWSLSSALAASSLDREAEDLEILLAPGDTVKFDILDDEKDPIDLMISDSGEIQAPFVGGVKISGLTLRAALQKVTQRYIESEIFRKPRIGLSVAEYRPVFVIGDVQSPGSYSYQPKLTIEKAIGLAGGQITSKPAEDPFLQRARVRGQLSSLKANIIAEAIAYARVTAQLENRVEILDSDIPAMARPYMDESLVNLYREIELKILRADVKGFVEQRENLKEGLKEAELSLDLFNKLYGKLEKAIEFTKADLDRAKGLQERGIQTLSNVSNIERQLTNEEARMLQVLTMISDERRGVGQQKRELSSLEQTRKMRLLDELQKRNTSLATIIFERRTAEEQLVLLSTMSEEELKDNKQVTLEFMVRRDNGRETNIFRGNTDTLLEPGDVVMVRMLREGESSGFSKLGNTLSQSDNAKDKTTEVNSKLAISSSAK
ncbi:hypothetical protein GR183_21220 [Stappia sp. GBMRC 2046]|uniref:Polysaccharide export outer membrane protein n=1 Tax=Stappia sediminis TaxID=2692190 RepID=A0A7X3LYJ5_9HYPH|nr:polysaccharide biosynthesis/export family protein [Stappia sediminis]MXN67436.1 hypothetical protein [Stappia sediminis]